MTNTTFRRCPWADLLVAMDAAWWAKHGEEASKTFHGDFVTLTPDAGQYGATVIDSPPEGHGNSGAMAIRQALNMGAQRVILLGYDCQHTGGQTHWHGSHPDGLGDAASLPRWPAQFEAVAHAAQGRVINATRDTALTCFELATLDQALEMPCPS